MNIRPVAVAVRRVSLNSRKADRASLLSSPKRSAAGQGKRLMVVVVVDVPLVIVVVVDVPLVIVVVVEVPSGRPSRPSWPASTTGPLPAAPCRPGRYGPRPPHSPRSGLSYCRNECGETGAPTAAVGPALFTGCAPVAAAQNIGVIEQDPGSRARHILPDVLML